MAYDELMAARIRDALAQKEGIAEKKMFGGISFLLLGNMAVGVIKDELCVRVDPNQFESLLARPGTRAASISLDVPCPAG
jgi:TfoX/Sxy family transcriptional regulator of competence genes